MNCGLPSNYSDPTDWRRRQISPLEVLGTLFAASVILARTGAHTSQGWVTKYGGELAPLFDVNSEELHKARLTP